MHYVVERVVGRGARVSLRTVSKHRRRAAALRAFKRAEKRGWCVDVTKVMNDGARQAVRTERVRPSCKMAR